MVTRVVQRVLGLDEAPWTLHRRLADPLRPRVHHVRLRLSLRRPRGSSATTPRSTKPPRGSAPAASLRLRRVTLPLLTPRLAGAMLLVFMSALGSFSAPYIFGGGLRVLSTQILASQAQRRDGTRLRGDHRARAHGGRGARAPALVRAAAQYAMTGKGRATRTAIRVARLARGGASLGASALVFVLILPHAMVVLVAFARDGAWTTQVLPPAYTLENFRASPPTRTSGCRSGTACAWRRSPRRRTRSSASSRRTRSCCRRFRGRRVLELLAALPWAIPATAIAIGLASTFDRNDPLSGACCSWAPSGSCRSRTSSAASRS